MLRRHLLLVFWCSLLATAGCGGSRGTAKGNLNGIEYDLPSFGSVMTSIDTANGLVYQTQGLKVHIHEGKVAVNDKDYGAIQSGDRLQVTTDFKVLINGKERTPVP